MVQSTADLASSVLFSKDHHREAWARNGYTPTAEDFELAAKALEWARGYYGSIPVEQRSPFEHNMFVATKGETVTGKTMGFVAYAVQGYLKVQEMEFQTKLEAQRPSQHVGVEGLKVVVKATVLSASQKASDFGPGEVYTYKFQTTDGDRMTWFASNPIILGETEDGSYIKADRGDVVCFVGTVKKHGEWKGVKDTVVTRCQIIEEADFGDNEVKAAKANAKPKKRRRLAADANQKAGPSTPRRRRLGGPGF